MPASFERRPWAGSSPARSFRSDARRRFAALKLFQQRGLLSLQGRQLAHLDRPEAAEFLRQRGKGQGGGVVGHIEPGHDAVELALEVGD